MSISDVEVNTNDAICIVLAYKASHGLYLDRLHILQSVSAISQYNRTEHLCSRSRDQVATMQDCSVTAQLSHPLSSVVCWLTLAPVKVYTAEIPTFGAWLEEAADVSGLGLALKGPVRSLQAVPSTTLAMILPLRPCVTTSLLPNCLAPRAAARRVCTDASNKVHQDIPTVKCIILYQQ